VSATSLHILEQTPLGSYSHLSLHWPDTLLAPLPGQRLQLHDGQVLWPMRPAQGGKLDVLSATPVDEPQVTLTAIIGQALSLTPEQTCTVLAEGIALAPLIHLCATRRTSVARTLALYQLSEPPAFRPRPSQFLLDGMPDGVIAAIPLLDDWGIPSRLASPGGQPGCHDGTLDSLLCALKPQDFGKTMAFGSADFLRRLGLIQSLDVEMETPK